MKLAKLSLIALVLIAAASSPVLTGCNKIKAIKEVSEMIQGDRLYFCERYVTKEIGEGSKFKAGKITIMLKLKNPIGESTVDINVTDQASGKVVNTFPFTVQPGWDYIHFDDVEFKEKGKFKVSCLKKTGDVLCSGEVEII
jgi:hypothetical protein